MLDPSKEGTPTNGPSRKRIIIVGAGLGGTMMAVMLAKSGHKIDIYERREDPRSGLGKEGRSINLTLATRGLNVLKEAGLYDKVIANTVPLEGRMIHSLDGRIDYQPYGNNRHQVIHSIMRDDISLILTECADALENVTMHFNMRCVSIDKDAASARFQHEKKQETIEANGDLIIGSDGAYSTVLYQMHHKERISLSKQYFDWGYKELTIPAKPDGSPQLLMNGFHMWPRKDCLVLVMSNLNGSFTCSVCLPFEGELSFESIKTKEQVAEFFKERFPKITPLIPNIEERFLERKPVQMMTLKLGPWYYKDKMVVLGDACHAIVPFYGQGMNITFEDCSCLSRLMVEYPDDLETAFEKYQQQRKPQTDAMADLSVGNFSILQNQVHLRYFNAYRKVEMILNRLAPKLWIPLYTLVAHTTLPVTQAVNRFKRQQRILRWTGGTLIMGGLALIVMAWDWLSAFVLPPKHNPYAPLKPEESPKVP